MTTHATATVIDGVLKLDESLTLPNQTRVKLTIAPLTESTEPLAAWESLLSRLQQRPVHAEGLHFTRDELHERR